MITQHRANPATRLASDDQRALIRDLANERLTDLVTRESTLAIAAATDLRMFPTTRPDGSVITHGARSIIDELMKLPRPARRVPDAVDRFEGIPKPCRFAVDTAALSERAIREFAGADANDLVFVFVNEYHGHTYVRQLLGAPGSFRKLRIASRDTENELLALIRTDATKASQRFGAAYSICGRCGSELTDVVSRAANMGPECRSIMGL